MARYTRIINCRPCCNLYRVVKVRGNAGERRSWAPKNGWRAFPRPTQALVVQTGCEGPLQLTVRPQIFSELLGSLYFNHCLYIISGWRSIRLTPAFSTRAILPVSVFPLSHFQSSRDGSVCGTFTRVTTWCRPQQTDIVCEIRNNVAALNGGISLPESGFVRCRSAAD